MNTILDFITKHANDKPDATAFEILGSFKKTITYRKLNEQVSQHAQGLAKHCQSGERVLLIYSTSLDFIIAFLACLKAEVLPVPIYPPSGNKHRLFAQLSNLDLILRNVKPSCILTDRTTKALLFAHKIKQKFFKMWPTSKAKLSSDLQIYQYPLYTLSNIKTGRHLQLPEISSESAFLQFTSGSTGNPKGVLITHENILDNTQKISRVLTRVENIVSWLPLYHDMGIMNGLFLPLYCGIPARILSPLEFLSSPKKWLETISLYKNCASGGPNFSYEYCIKKTKEKIQQIDLSHWRVAYIGAEKNHVETLKRFNDAFGQYGFDMNNFYPCYGLAESTVGVTGRNAGGTAEELCYLHIDSIQLQQGIIEIKNEPSSTTTTLLSCGTWPSTDTVIAVDPVSCAILPERKTGEIWCQNKSVGNGYWQNQASTEHYFRAFTQDKQGPFLRTGDLGFIHEKQLYITGRIKDLIIIRGRNFCAEDIEWACQHTHRSIRPSGICAFSFSKDLEEKLALIIEIKKQPSTAKDIFESIRKKISIHFGIKIDTIVLVKERTLHKTSSGKLKRSACKNAFLKGTLSVLAQQKSNLEITIMCNLMEYPTYFTDPI
jgi:acyl-CoA synthetase (AMP-forming)/AMP-acid ligase II